VLPSQSLLRVPTIEQSQLAQTLHERLISKPGNNFPLSSSVSFAEDLSSSADRINYGKHQYLEGVKASESIADITSDSQTSQLCSERILSGTSITDTECRKSANASEQECSLEKKPVNCYKDEQDSRRISEGFSACSKVSAQSLNCCQGCEDLVHVNGRQEYCSLHTMDEILMSNKEETNISQNGQTPLPLDSQLEEIDGVSKVSFMRINVTLTSTFNMNSSNLRQ
jgi:hypothetical protein